MATKAKERRGTIRLETGEQIHYVDTGELVEPAHDSKGRLIDNAYVERVVERARRAGRPSVSGSGGGTSPQVQIRVSAELKSEIDAAAAADHTSRADWMRRALHREAARRLAKG